MLYSNAQQALPLLKVSPDGRYFMTADGKPFFWLGDTGWLLFVKCNREETRQYLDTRQSQGFNVVQVMVVHDMGSAKNKYDDSALVNHDIAHPKTTPGNDFNNPAEYDFWDHVDFVVEEAAKRGIYMALVPLWGGNVKDGKVSVQQATAYAKFLAERYGKYNNIIWVNGGDIMGSDGLDVWKAIGKTLKQYDTRHLETFHPRGRYSSSEWFHNEPWLDFDMFQSGHRDYAQDTSVSEKNHFGEDNWRYVVADYTLKPTKPTMDGEPSYENIPHGLHDSLANRWTADDLRRYAYWNVFAGGAGFTYGENAVMQFHTIGEKGGSFGVAQNWKETIHAKGATQMHFIKELMVGRSFFDRKPAQEIVENNSGDRYNYVLATRGKGYAMVYTYTGRNIEINTSKLGFKIARASWFNPRDGITEPIKQARFEKIAAFDPPGDSLNGNDWVLVLER